MHSQPTRITARNPMLAGWPDRLFLLLLFLASVFYFWGVASVPFHPDEATQLFMSADFESLWRSPASLAWLPGQEGDLRQYYREVDAPLTRYLVGLGGWIAGQPPTPVDWDWSQTWSENQAAGALPTPAALLAGRLAVAALFPFTLTCLYWSGKKIGKPGVGLLAVLLAATNALILLHTRRAMAEGALAFGIAFSLWAILAGRPRPWLIGLALALAFNAKQSAIALLPVGLLAVLWLPSLQEHPREETVLPVKPSLRWKGVKPALLRVAALLAVFGGVTLALNPFLWGSPLQAALSAWQARQDLVQRQVATLESLAPGQVLNSPLQKAVGLIGNTFITPPAIYDVGNYRAETAAAERAYLGNPLNTLLRGALGGLIVLAFTLFGLLLGISNLLRPGAPYRRSLSLLLLATLLQSAALLAAVPLPYQRYWVPLALIACLWCAYGLAHMIDLILPKQRQLSSPPSRREKGRG